MSLLQDVESQFLFPQRKIIFKKILTRIIDTLKNKRSVLSKKENNKQLKSVRILITNERVNRTVDDIYRLKLRLEKDKLFFTVC